MIVREIKMRTYQIKMIIEKKNSEVYVFVASQKEKVLLLKR